MVSSVFIVFEGIDGAGKTTQATLLAEQLRQCHRDPLITQEPGTTEVGLRVRQMVKGNDEGPLRLSGLVEALLFAAARAQLVAEIIRPALAAGRTVVSDRYTYSTVAYQGAGRGLDRATIDQVNHIATGGLTPDLVILLDLTVEAARQRQRGRAADRFDEESAAFYRRVRDSYLQQAAADPARWLIVDGAQPVEVIAQEIWKFLSERLGCP